MEEATSKFNINLLREVFVLGEHHHASLIKKLLKGYYFLALRDGKDLGASRPETYFIVYACDFSNPTSMQAVAKTFQSVESPLAHRILFIVQPNELSREQLLFAQEVGARYVAAGPGKTDDFKNYIKRICVEAHQVGSLEAYEDEIEVAYRASNWPDLAAILERLKALPESEDGLRLMAITAMRINDLRRAEGYLRRLLAVNSQNLWAANTLGKLFLRSGKANLGIEILTKLSQFHELNSERLLTLGNAHVQTGDTRAAEANFKMGDQLTGGADRRFREGLAKVKLADKDYQGALGLLGEQAMSEDVISFLNMRAIMSIRSDRFDEGVEYYNYAFKGAGTDKELQAKIMFNMGLAYVRTVDLDRAKECFKESCLLGGTKFQRAKKPLEIVVTAIKNKDKPKKSGANEAKQTVDLDDIEWETLY